MSPLWEMLSPDFVLRNSLYASLLLGAVLPRVGIHLVVSHRTMLALALPEVSNLGVALAALLGTYLGWVGHAETSEQKFFALSLTGALCLMAATLWALYRIQRLKSASRVPDTEPGSAHDDAEESALFVTASAATLSIAASRVLPELGILSALRGELLAVSGSLLVCLAVGFGGVLAVLTIFNRPLQLLLFDARLAYAQGLPVEKLQALSLGVICVSIALGGLCSGPFAVFAFLVIPSNTLFPFTRHFDTLCLGASVMGFGCALGGFYISYAWESLNLPTSTAQGLCLGGVWICSRFWGWVTHK